MEFQNTLEMFINQIFNKANAKRLYSEFLIHMVRWRFKLLKKGMSNIWKPNFKFFEKI